MNDYQDQGTPPPILSWQYLYRASSLEFLASMGLRNQILLLICLLTLIVLNLAFFRLQDLLDRPKPGDKHPRPKTSPSHPTRLLVVLGSGGHTAEMLNMLRRTPLLQIEYTHRTYVVSSGDNFSAEKAVEFERVMLKQLQDEDVTGAHEEFEVVTVRRARRVHQSIWTAPLSSLACLWDCIRVLRGVHPDCKTKDGLYPDLILTNGPGTGVCVVVAASLLLFLGFARQKPQKDVKEEDRPYYASGQMRSIYVESWARVKTLSLSGRLLKPFVDRFIVQWPDLVKAEGKRVEYLGPLVS